ncbi:MAG TPA: hypothetical protein V6D10_19980 [Trichocoleus sp.]|jgi:hypothetical protein
MPPVWNSFEVNEFSVFRFKGSDRQGENMAGDRLGETLNELQQYEIQQLKH